MLSCSAEPKTDRHGVSKRFVSHSRIVSHTCSATHPARRPIRSFDATLAPLFDAGILHSIVSVPRLTGTRETFSARGLPSLSRNTSPCRSPNKRGGGPRSGRASPAGALTPRGQSRMDTRMVSCNSLTNLSRPDPAAVPAIAASASALSATGVLAAHPLAEPSRAAAGKAEAGKGKGEAEGAGGAADAEEPGGEGRAEGTEGPPSPTSPSSLKFTGDLNEDVEALEVRAVNRPVRAVNQPVRAVNRPVLGR
eukprot:575383-Prorocentrum_minimum.AAC.2